MTANQNSTGPSSTGPNSTGLNSTGLNSTALAAFAVQTNLDRTPPDYAPGDTLRLEVTASERLADCQGAELSVVWYTTGKGEEDLTVHDFQRLSKTDLAATPLKREPLALELTLETTLPLSPLSYAGHAVKVCWAARVRVYLPGGRQLVREAPFRLGEVDPAASNNTKLTAGGGSAARAASSKPVATNKQVAGRPPRAGGAP